MAVHDVSKEQLHLESINHLTEWKSTQLNIGVMGATGLQKHTFINNLVCATSKLENTNEDSEYLFITPVEPIGHVHSINKNIIFWEMPESLDLSQNEYIDLIKLERYDLLLICQCESKDFDENDIYIADLVRAKKIPVFFIKFHCKDATLNVSELESIYNLEFQIIEKINNEYKVINSEPYKNHYLISPECCSNLDLNKLMIDLIHSLKDTKSETLTFTVEPFSRDLIIKKYETLRSKTYHSAIISTLCGIFTHIVPGVGLIVDLGFLIQEIRFYLSQFNLHEEGLIKTTNKHNVTYDELLFVISKSSYGSLIILKDVHTLTSVLIKVLPVLAAASALDSIKIFPVVGHIIHGTMSFFMTKIALIKILDEFCNVALEINDLIGARQNYKNLSEKMVKDAELNDKEGYETTPKKIDSV